MDVVQMKIVAMRLRKNTEGLEITKKRRIELFFGFLSGYGLPAFLPTSHSGHLHHERT
jgi:hypothetical protein